MAKKGQKFRKYSDKEREDIVTKYLSGNYSYGILAREYQMSRNTIVTIIRRFNATGNTKRSKRGRPKKNLTIEDYKERYEIVKKYQAFLKAQREKK